MKKLHTFVIIALVVAAAIAYGFWQFASNLAGGLSTEQEAPVSIAPGEPAVVRLILGAWGGSAPIKDGYSGIVLYHRLSGGSEYSAIAARPTALPENYARAMSDGNRWEAYSFTIPPYQEGVAGEIEYYIDFKFDGESKRIEGVRTIRIEDEGPGIDGGGSSGGTGGQACTMDAKLCPDGSYVGRIPPSCEFSACPAVRPSRKGGIKGSVLLGPVCPVVREGEECPDRPYETDLVVTSVDYSRQIAAFRSLPDGSFIVDVPPGEYMIQSAVLTGSFNRCFAGPVLVAEGAYAEVGVKCDTGIR